MQISITDPVLMFQNPEAFKKYAEDRERYRREEEDDNVDSRPYYERIHEQEMAKRAENPPALKDEYISNFLANQNARRGPTVGVDTGDDVKIQSKEELARITPIRRTGPKPEFKHPEEKKEWH